MPSILLLRGYVPKQGPCRRLTTYDDQRKGLNARASGLLSREGIDGCRHPGIGLAKSHRLQRCTSFKRPGKVCHCGQHQQDQEADRQHMKAVQQQLLVPRKTGGNDDQYRAAYEDCHIMGGSRLLYCSFRRSRSSCNSRIAVRTDSAAVNCAGRAFSISVDTAHIAAITVPPLVGWPPFAIAGHSLSTTTRA